MWFLVIMLVVFCFILVLWGWCKVLLEQRTPHMLVKCTVVFALYFILWLFLGISIAVLVESPAAVLLPMLILAFPMVFVLTHFFGAHRNKAIVITALTTVSWIALPFILAGISWLMWS